MNRAWAGMAVVAAALGALPWVVNAYLVSFVFALLIAFVIAQSWDWVNGQMGYLNLGHYAFYGIGGYAFCIALVHGVPLALCFAAALAASAAAAALLSVPLFRLRGDYFAFATLTIVPLCELLASNLSDITRGSEGITLPPNYVLVPAYYLAVLLALAAFGATLALMRSRFGYAMRAVRNDEQVAEVSGVRLFPVKLMTLTLSAAFAGMAGAIQAWQFSFIDPYTMFNIGIALIPVAAALLGGSGLLFGPLVGVALLTTLQQALLVNINMLQGAAYGLVIVLIGRFLPGGLLRWRAIAGNPRLAWLSRESHFEMPAVRGGARGDALPLEPGRNGGKQVLLECRSVVMAFGGNVALRGISLRIQPGEIIGLVGSNGSGKTTLFNLISGVHQPKSGAVLIDGRDIRGLRADEISTAGVGRTFQIPRPFGELTARECIAIGGSFGRGRATLSEAMKAAETFARFAGLEDALDRRAGLLTLQQQKLLEIARALAGGPRILLVDEVASGLSTAEISAFVELIRGIRDRHGVTVIWVEHIFSALSQVVDRLIVLDSGAVIADAPLAEAMRDEKVIAAYLGHAPQGAE